MRCSDDASRPASPTPAAPAKQAAAAAPAPTRGTQKPRGGPASRGGRYYQRGGKSAPRDKENAEATGDDSEPRKRGMFSQRTGEKPPLMKLTPPFPPRLSTFGYLV